MKILMLVPLWRRPEVVAMFIRHMMDNVCPYAEVEPLFILSPEDESYRQLLTITDGFHQCEVFNEPLGRKKNFGLRYAMNYKWDYLMDMGSDDVYTTVMWEMLEEYLHDGLPCFGFNNLYFYNALTDKAKFVPGYHLNLLDKVSAIGPGRCIRRDVALKCFPLWPDAPFGLDGASDKKIQDAGYTISVIDCEEIPVICDVKSGVTLTGWDYLDDMGKEVTPEFVKDAFDLWGAQSRISDFDSFHREVRRMSTQTPNVRDAFNRVNNAYRDMTGELRYASYNSYCVAVSRKMKRNDE